MKCVTCETDFEGSWTGDCPECERRILAELAARPLSTEAKPGSVQPDGCAASADEWGKIGQDAAREAIKQKLAGHHGNAQQLQNIAKLASETEIAIRQTMQHNAALSGTERKP